MNNMAMNYELLYNTINICLQKKKVLSASALFFQRTTILLLPSNNFHAPIYISVESGKCGWGGGVSFQAGIRTLNPWIESQMYSE